MERIGKRERGMEGIGRHTLVSAVSTVEGTVRPSHGCRQTPREDGGGEEEGRYKPGGTGEQAGWDDEGSCPGNTRGMTQWVWGDHWQLVIPADPNSRENDNERERERGIWPTAVRRVAGSGRWNRRLGRQG